MKPSVKERERAPREKAGKEQSEHGVRGKREVRIRESVERDGYIKTGNGDREAVGKDREREEDYAEGTEVEERGRK